MTWQSYQIGLVARVSSPVSMIAEVAMPSFETWEMFNPSTEDASPSFDIYQKKAGYLVRLRRSNVTKPVLVDLLISVLISPRERIHDNEIEQCFSFTWFLV